MATILLGEQKGRGGRLERTEKGYVFRSTRTYIVKSDAKNESEYTVCMTSGLPIVGVTPTTDGATCRGLTPKQDTKSPYIWFVTADFDTEPINQNMGDPVDPNPTTWIPIYKGKIETFPEVLYEDFSSTPKKYVNSANNKFPEPLIVNRPIIVYEFPQYEDSSLTDVQIGDRNDTVNSGSVRGFAAQTLKCNISEFERGWYYGFECVRINYRIAYKKSTWLNKPLDMGYEYRPTAGAVAISSPGGKLVALNSDGTLRADTSAPLALDFKAHREISFSFLR